MGKSKRRNQRRHNDDSSSTDDESTTITHTEPNDTSQKTPPTTPPTTQKLNFRDRRELQRKQAAEKRRSKQRCFLCGQLGHVRRSCPGVEDDGRGMSKHTKAKGDTGAVGLRMNRSGGGGNGSNNSSTKGKKSKKQTAAAGDTTLEMPDGFEPVSLPLPSSSSSSSLVAEETDTSTAAIDPSNDSTKDESFVYYDCLCDSTATLQYLQSGRSGSINQKHKKEAVEEYRTVLKTFREISNFGGCITPIYWKNQNQYWVKDSSVPLPWWNTTDGGTEEVVVPFPSFFVIGLDHGWDCRMSTTECTESVLRSACEDPRVVGLCAQLDYSDLGQSAGGTMDREAQLARINSTCAIAMAEQLPIQIQILPGATTEQQQQQNGPSNEENNSPYSMVLRDLRTVLERPENIGLKVHLASWMGTSSDMTLLLQTFPDTLYIGINGHVSFSKATQAHECAFDLPLNRLLLESGRHIPAPVASALGRRAFPHSGLVPFVAVAFAEHKDGASPRDIAMQASLNAIQVYHKIGVAS